MLFLGIMLLLSTALAYAQSRVINGKVLDDKGDPVSGASVIIKGTTRGTSADASGAFSITASTGELLDITASNFGKSEVRLGSQNSITITLKRNANVMEEVVVTALGQTSTKSKSGLLCYNFYK